MYADVKTQLIDDWTLVVMYRSSNGDDSIFTPDNIRWMNWMNDQIISRNFSLYYNLCLADIDDVDDGNGTTSMFPDCSAERARVDPLYDAFNVSLPSQSEIDYFLNETVSEKAKEGDLVFLSCFGPDLVEEPRSNKMYRAFFRFGLPYPDRNRVSSSFQSHYDRFPSQEQFYIDYVFPTYQHLQVREDAEYGAVEVVIGGAKVRDLQFDSFAPSGIVYAVGSGLSVLVIMSLHLNSLFLSISGLVQILCAFPFSYFLFRVAFGIIYFDAMCLLIIFVILGIGADDAFVLVDAFTQSHHLVVPSESESDSDDHRLLLVRMSYAYKRASKAMLVTTLTTAIAFGATALSPLMPIAAFGIWATLCVLANYALVITLYPCLVSIHYLYVRRYEQKAMLRLKGLVCWETRKHSLLMGDTKRAERARWIERMFRDKFSVFILRFKWLIFVCSMALLAISGYFGSQIEGLSEEEMWFPETHFMQKMIEWPDDYFGGAISELITMRMVWGIEEAVDRENVNTWNPDDWGRVQFDDDFDLSPMAAQEHMMAVCDALLNDTDLLYDAQNNLKCFMYDLRAYGERSQNLSFPFLLDAENATNNRRLFDDFVSAWTQKDELGKKWLSEGYVGYHGTERALKYVLIEFLLKEKKYVSSSEKDKIWSLWEGTMAEYNRVAPESVSKGFQIDTFAFSWSASEQGFITSAIQGISIAMPAALICLGCSTRNWIVSLFAIFSICGIIAAELAVMVWNGWELGTAESIAVVIMIGFSVDYVVHLGNAYVECSGQYEHREQRLRYSLFTMGISVLSGAVTTFSSAFWLVFPVFLFYKKFSILLMTTSFFSILYAFFFFMSLLAIMGPSGDTGHILNVCRKSRRKTSY